MHSNFTRLNRRRLCMLLGLLFLALVLPTAILVLQAKRQLKWESLHQHRVLAEELAQRIDDRLKQIVDNEEARAFSDYAFLVVAGDPAANFVQRSPLSEYPPKTALPGLIGYFQVDAAGNFSTPILPAQLRDAASYGISAPELEQRRTRQTQVLEILSRNRLLHADDKPILRRRDIPAPAQKRRNNTESTEIVTASDDEKDQTEINTGTSAATIPVAAGIQPVQSAFDELSQKAVAPKTETKPSYSQTLGRLQEKQTEQRRPAETLNKLVLRSGRKEQSALPVPQVTTKADQPKKNIPSPMPVRITTFESEIDPFEFNRLASGHFVLFRKVWRNKQRYIQGLLLESEVFLQNTIAREFEETTLSRIGELTVSFRDEPLSVWIGSTKRSYQANTAALPEKTLYHSRFSSPLNDLGFQLTLQRLPVGPGAVVIHWASGILAIVLCGGFYLLYRLGTRLIDLTRQQQDFISAISHELKTPLTSIRMYGEMLRAGWVDETKKPTYYDFIYSESERLSRLIENVLQLAHLSRNKLTIELKLHTVDELLDTTRSKITSTIEQAGFVLNIQCTSEVRKQQLMIDSDSYTQIIINLVDNALKFSAKAIQKSIDLHAYPTTDNRLVISVRDYGPGIPKDQKQKIFGLFYRLENELTRETAGTGIGLALVHQLTQAMNAKIEVSNREPGTEFRLVFGLQTPG